MSHLPSIPSHTQPIGGSGGTARNSLKPVTLYVKSVTVLQAGSPADIATITIPSEITKWAVYPVLDSTGGFAVNSIPSLGYVESSASINVATFEIRTATAGGGTNIGNFWGDLGTLGGDGTYAVATMPITDPAVFTSSTIVIRQTTNSVSAGTVSFYITIFPLP